MKKMQVRFFLVAVLFSNGLSMQGMTSAARAARIVRQPVGRRLQSSWSSRGKEGKQTLQEEKVELEGFSSSDEGDKEPQEKSWLSRVWKSFFEKKLPSVAEVTKESEEELGIKKILTPDELRDKIDHFIAGTVRGFVFDHDAYVTAKKSIDRMIEQNPEYLMYQMSFPYGFYFKPDRSAVLHFTIPEFVFFMAIAGDRGETSKWVDVSDSMFNLLKWVEYFIDTDVFTTLSSENQEVLDYAYCIYLMESYEVFYERVMTNKHSTDVEELSKLKKVFNKLDPLIARLELNKNIRQNIEQAQQKRQEIEADEQLYVKKKEDNANRKKYINEKQDYLFRQYQKRTGDYESYPYEVKDRTDKAEFNDAEYQDWLVRDKNSNFFDKQSGGGTEFSIDEESDQRIKDLISHFGLPSDASDAMIIRRVKDYIMHAHPDKLPKDMPKEEKEQKEKEFGEFMGRYDDVIDELKKRERQEKQNRE